MKKAPVKIGLFAFGAFVILCGAGALLTWKYQKSTQAKIEFILWDRSHANDADLSEKELIRYVNACGATTTIEGSEIHVSYDKTFVSKTWSIARQAQEVAP